MIADLRSDEELWPGLHRLPSGSGVLVLDGKSPHHRRRLRRLGAARALTIVYETSRIAARVHNLRELRRALLARTPMILLSPLYPTQSHPDWKPIPRMRAAALARLGHRRLFALGGMDQRRFRRLQRLGFIGWAGISAWLDPKKPSRE